MFHLRIITQSVRGKTKNIPSCVHAGVLHVFHLFFARGALVAHQDLILELEQKEFPGQQSPLQYHSVLRA